MSTLGWAVSAFGVLIIITRGPLIFAPEATLEVYRKLIASVSLIRAVGVIAGGAGGALVASADGSDGVAASVVSALGWILVASAVWLIVFPSVYRSVAEMVLDMIGDVARPLGVIAVAMGFALVWLGVAVL